MDYSLFRNGLISAGLNDLSELQISQFDKFYEKLIETNKVMNLTAITDPCDVQIKHFLDSSMCLKSGLFKTGMKVIDIGTGAGFPGIPLKIIRPDLKFSLVDSLNKRIGFLSDIIETLHLENTEAIHARAEDLARNTEYREKFDICVSRAVANLNILSEYCIPFIKPGGYFIAYKSGDIQKELNGAAGAVKKLSSSIEGLEYFDLPQSDISRSFVIIKKNKPVSPLYPRKAGTPQKKPLT